mgnify:FL=1
MNPHISEQYDAELDATRNQLMEMGGMVEKQLRGASDALVGQDAVLAETVLLADKRVNQLEVEIDEQCVNIIARRQPAASDLRTLISILKASTDLERVGDEAGRVAKMAISLAENGYSADELKDFRHIANLTQEMVASSLDAFARLDTEGAMRVIASDAAIDDAYDELVRQRSSNMREDPDAIQRDMSVIWAARALERIGDHAKNICEYVVYLVRGQDLRQRNKQIPS